MIDKLFKLIVIVFVGGFLLYLIPLIIYLFIFQPLQIREPISNKYPIGANVIVNKLSSKFGSFNNGDIIAFKSLKNPDIDVVGVIERVEQETIFIANYPAPLKKTDIIGKIMFCYANCK